MEAIKAVFSAIANVVNAINKLVTAGHAEATKIQNASIKSLIEEQPLTKEEIEKAKKLFEQNF